jgi:hypothetical protein
MGVSALAQSLAMCVDEYMTCDGAFWGFQVVPIRSKSVGLTMVHVYSNGAYLVDISTSVLDVHVSVRWRRSKVYCRWVWSATSRASVNES